MNNEQFTIDKSLPADNRRYVWQPWRSFASAQAPEANDWLDTGDASLIKVIVDISHSAGSPDLWLETSETIDGEWTQLGELLSGLGATEQYFTSDPTDSLPRFMRYVRFFMQANVCASITVERIK